MVSLSKIALLASVAVASASHDYYKNGEYDEEAQNRDASCANNCFFQFFTNKCNSDNPACVCTLNDMRKEYFCCVAKKCQPYVVSDIMESSSDDCVAWKKPFTFDVEASCGVKLPSDESDETGKPASSSEAPKTTSSVADANTAAPKTSEPASTSAPKPSETSSTESDSKASATTEASDKPTGSATTSAAVTSTTAKAAGSRVGWDVSVLALPVLAAALW